MTDQNYYLKILKTLCDAFGPSSYEENLLDIIQEFLGQTFYHQITPHKNLIVFNPQDKNKTGRTIVFQSHMDELGIKPRNYLDNGLIEVIPVSYISNDFHNQKIIFKPGNISGLLMIKKEGDKKKYYVDIGVSDKEAVESLVPVYAFGAAKNSIEFKEDKIFGKSFDARAGIASIISAISSKDIIENSNNKLVGVFTSREESSFWPHKEISSVLKNLDIRPDLFINIEVCPGTLMPFIAPTGVELGKGAVIAHMDGSYVSPSYISKKIIEIGKINNIKYQDMVSNAGNGELGKLCYELETEGIGFTIPAYAMHSPNSIIYKEDYINMVNYLKAIMREW